MSLLFKETLNNSKNINKDMPLTSGLKVGFGFALLLVVSSGFIDDVQAARRDRTRLPVPTANLIVNVVFDGQGNWRNPRNGAYSDIKYHRTFSYIVPLKGGYSAASGFKDIDRVEGKNGVFIPNLKRYLILKPRDQLRPTNGACGNGSTEVVDHWQGMMEGDPGMPPLVPFDRTVQGGGHFPSGDKTVTESDLCEAKVTIDNDKHLMHLYIDGMDSTVKVKDQTNDLPPRSYNLPLQGYIVDASLEKKLTFTELPLPEGGNEFSGSRVIEHFNEVDGPDHSVFPLRATVEWRVVLGPASE